MISWFGRATDESVSVCDDLEMLRCMLWVLERALRTPWMIKSSNLFIIPMVSNLSRLITFRLMKLRFVCVGRIRTIGEVLGKSELLSDKYPVINTVAAM